MLGTDKSRGMGLEIFLDFLGGANVGETQPYDRTVMQSRVCATSLCQKQPRIKLAKEEYEIIRNRVLERDGRAVSEMRVDENLGRRSHQT